MKGFPFQTAGNRRISIGISPTSLGKEKPPKVVPLPGSGTPLETLLPPRGCELLKTWPPWTGGVELTHIDIFYSKGKPALGRAAYRDTKDVPGDEVGVPVPLIDAEDGLTEIPSQYQETAMQEFHQERKEGSIDPKRRKGSFGIACPLETMKEQVGQYIPRRRGREFCECLGSFPSVDTEIPPEPGMPQGEPGHGIQHPAPPEIPRLDQPLINDHDHFIGLQQRFQLYYLGRNQITDLAEFARRLEGAVPIERDIEAALVFDGYDPDRIRGRINEIRGILFVHPTRMFLLSEQTLARDLNEIQTNGTRQCAPYMRIVSAICNYDLIL
ncbi:hypothetical protein U1Q18_016537 [Sarracenia purpurea var. burkii]